MNVYYGSFTKPMMSTITLRTSRQPADPVVYTVSQKKRTNFETVQLKIIRIDFDEIWQKYSKDSRIEFACFSFRACLLF